MPSAACRAFSELIDTSEPPSRSFRPACLATMNDPVRQTSIDGAELVDGQVGDGAVVAESRAVDDDVERAGLLEQPGHRVLVGDVDLRGGVRLAQFGGAGRRAVGVAVGDDHPAALGGQPCRDGPADPGRSADDDRYPIGFRHS